MLRLILIHQNMLFLSFILYILFQLTVKFLYLNLSKYTCIKLPKNHWTNTGNCLTHISYLREMYMALEGAEISPNVQRSCLRDPKIVFLVLTCKTIHKTHESWLKIHIYPKITTIGHLRCSRFTILRFVGFYWKENLRKRVKYRNIESQTD